ncbi:MAG: monovalent cation/H(+) antiporter subunit G [Halobacteria archaeon]|nr:monovalent cation/H(+) antiporter subunit G [Halobacteria archaeon]
MLGEFILVTEASSKPPLAVIVVTSVLIVVGLFFVFAGTLGLLRMPNVYNRLHATTKATTIGASSLLLANMIYLGPAEIDTGLRAVLGIIFLFLTAPTGAHMISRSAQRMGVEFFGEAEWPPEAEEESDEED